VFSVVAFGGIGRSIEFRWRGEVDINFVEERKSPAWRGRYDDSISSDFSELS
jgi:hypothetical protein